MATISVRLNNEDSNLIKEYAKANGYTISQLIRDVLIEYIEDDLDVEQKKEIMEAREKMHKEGTVDAETVWKRLGL